MIELKDVSVLFKDNKKEIHAVKDVDLTVKKGDIFGIIGYSGAGKSTLIRTVNLLQMPTIGKVYISGKEITALNKKDLRKMRKRIGMIFQHFNLLKSKTVFDNVMFPLKYSQLSKRVANEKVFDLLNLVGLSDKASAYPSQLSGGQKQRVAIARALANDPKILLCDEATSALDPQTTDGVLQLLKKVNRTLGLTILLITHEMNVIKEVCNKVAIMENGKIVESGHCIDVFSRPQNSLTRAFINAATQIDSSLKKMLSHTSILHLKPNAVLARISYVGKNTSQPIVASLISQFNVTTNIMAGNIEFIQGIAFGWLIVILTGSDEDKKQALAYLISQQVEVEIIDFTKDKKGDIHA